MSVAPVTPFDPLLAQLTQAMSAEGSPPVRHELGTQRDAAHTADDRVVWIPISIDAVNRDFTLPDDLVQTWQAWEFIVSIYGYDLARVGLLHELLVGQIDELIGPRPGSAPSADHRPADMIGSVDLAAFAYPFAGLDGLALTFSAPYPVTVPMPAGSLADPIALAVSIGAALRAIGSFVLATLEQGNAGELYLRLSLPADPLSTEAPSIALDPAAPLSACGVLGFDATPAIGAAPSNAYRPGYDVAKSQPGPRGGTPEAGGWGLIVPVTLYLPIRSIHWIRAMIQRTQFEVLADDDLAVSNPGAP